MCTQDEQYLIIDPINFLETCGDSSLLGLAFNEGIAISKGRELVIKFNQSSLAFRRKNNGPRLGICPEFALPCFLEDLDTLRSQGFRIRIEMYSTDFPITT